MADFDKDVKAMDVTQLEQIGTYPTIDATQAELIRQGEELDAVEKTMSFWAAVKQHKMIMFYMLAAYSCGACYGYDTIANGATLSMPGFLLYYGHFDAATQSLYLESNWVSLWSSMSGAGQVVGSLAAGYLAQRFGRRFAAMGCASFTIAGVAMQYVATEGGLLLAGKIINGFSIGALLAIGTTHGSELAPVSLKGPLLAGLAFFAVAMQCVGLGVIRAFVPDITPVSFRTAFALQWIVGGLPIILFFLAPESPNWLLMKGKHDAAKRSLERMYGRDNHIDARLAHLNNILRHEMEQDRDVSYLDCFKGTNLKRTLTVCLLFFGQGMIGSAFLTQNIYFLILAGLPAIHCFDINIAGFALALVIIPFSSMFSEKIGRRPLYLIGVAGNCVGMLIVGCLGFSSSKGTTWAVAVLLNLLITWQLFTCFMTSWAMAPELSSLKLRQQTQGVGYVVQAITTLLFLFVTPYMYNVDAGNLGAKTAFIFLGLSIILFAVAFFMVPETKGLTTEEIDLLYEDKVSPRKFGKRERAVVASKADM